MVSSCNGNQHCAQVVTGADGGAASMNGSGARRVRSTWMWLRPTRRFAFTRKAIGHVVACSWQTCSDSRAATCISAQSNHSHRTRDGRSQDTAQIMMSSQSNIPLFRMLFA
eukprot:7090252-Prymnesium_polylepis.1